jgi:hypothetical protein
VRRIIECKFIKSLRYNLLRETSPDPGTPRQRTLPLPHRHRILATKDELGRGDASDIAVCGGGEQAVATKKVVEV